MEVNQTFFQEVLDEIKTKGGNRITFDESEAKFEKVKSITP